MVNPIKHLIILMMENRSFDHYLGSLALEGRTDIEGIDLTRPGIPDLRGTLIDPWIMDGTRSLLSHPMDG